ncbi:MAG TPA: metal-dependent hydrolase [Chloroflexi bacterium]|nr:metal-dependent hydrolase [Chloroflexota bacterium]
MEEIREVKIIRSARRRKTVSGRLLPGGVLEIRAPERMSRRDLDRTIGQLRSRLLRRAQSASQAHSDAGLEARAEALNRSLFGGRLRWSSIRWATNQTTRWGSCTPGNGTIRISARLQTAPPWVCDYVLVHELAHLEVPDHSPAFWALVNRYRLTERARGYLMALGLEHDDEPPAR